MISAYRMALQISHNPYTDQGVRDLLDTGKIREAIALLKQQGVAHLDPVEEAEGGFHGAGYGSASCRDTVVIPCLGDIVHTDEHPFCDDASCPCHEDREQVNLLNDQIKQGLLTPREAVLIMTDRAV